MISCAVTAQLIRAFVFTYAKCNLFHDVTQKVQWPFAQSELHICCSLNGQKGMGLCLVECFETSPVTLSVSQDRAHL